MLRMFEAVRQEEAVALMAARTTHIMSIEMPGSHRAPLRMPESRGIATMRVGMSINARSQRVSSSRLIYLFSLPTEHASKNHPKRAGFTVCIRAE